MRRAQEGEFQPPDLNRRIRAVVMPLSLKNENCSGYDRGVLPFAIRLAKLLPRDLSSGVMTMKASKLLIALSSIAFVLQAVGAQTLDSRPRRVGVLAYDTKKREALPASD